MLKRTLLILGLVTTFGVIGGGGWFFFGATIQERLRRQPFNALAWRGEKTLMNDVRIRMVDDLLDRYNFRGMNHEQVISALGEPDKTEHFNDWDMAYWLGPERGWLSIDSEWLVFRLDWKKIVSDYRIVRD
jgi:hypothetical protein